VDILYYERRRWEDVTRIGIVGTGFMARVHAKRYREMDATVSAVAAPSGPVPFITEHALDAEAYEDATALCESATVDAIDLCTPSDTHADLVAIAAEYGLDTFVEKPVAPTLSDAERIAATVADADITCMVGHVLRYFPKYERAKSLYENGEIGNPGVARARRLSPFPAWGSDDWYADHERSGGVFIDLALHDFDYLRWLWGDVKRVFARNRPGPEEHGFATLRFANDAVGYVEASWAQEPSRGDLTTDLELAGDDGLIEFASHENTPFAMYSGDESTVESPVAMDGYRRELDHFLECVEMNVTPDVTVEDSIDSLRISLAARESAEMGRPVIPAEVSTEGVNA
jgi:UDP-N-acetylglucosamine 3-dehydrogenase